MTLSPARFGDELPVVSDELTPTPKVEGKTMEAKHVSLLDSTYVGVPHG